MYINSSIIALSIHAHVSTYVHAHPSFLFLIHLFPSPLQIKHSHATGFLDRSRNMILRCHRRGAWVLPFFGFLVILAAPTFFHLWQLRNFDPISLLITEESSASLHKALDAFAAPPPIAWSTQLISTGAAPEDSVLNKLHNLLGAPIGFVHPLPGFASEVCRRACACMSMCVG